MIHLSEFVLNLLNSVTLITVIIIFKKQTLTQKEMSGPDQLG
jgi:hypothetical protein